MPVLALAATSMAQEVSFGFEKDANFKALETYAWVDMNDPAQSLDALTARQLKSAVEAELAMKGLQRSDKDQADLLICFQVAFRKEREITVYDTGWGRGPGWQIGGIGRAPTSTIPIGSVVLEMYLRSQKLLVWSGNVTKTIDANASPDKRERRIQNGIQKLLRNYPPPR